ncbi:hypothetical protein QBC32DRAFT_196837, partial [Pseudoneurospora amorphoporcata]
TIGDIACLKDFNWKGRTDEERSILTALNPGHDMMRASAHPCIVLKTDRKHALVTTILAHNSGPWDQWRALSPKWKAVRMMSFAGARRQNSQRAFLRLSLGHGPR